MAHTQTAVLTAHELVSEVMRTLLVTPDLSMLNPDKLLRSVTPLPEMDTSSLSWDDLDLVVTVCKHEHLSCTDEQAAAFEEVGRWAKRERRKRPKSESFEVRARRN